MTIREMLAQGVRKTLGEDLPFSVTKPPRPDLGDYTTNAAFLVAKRGRRNVGEVAEELSRKFLENTELTRMVAQITIQGGFINFFLKHEFSRNAFTQGAADAFLPSRKRKGKVLVEYSSPNIGKPLSIAHIRSTIIGDALARIYRALGYTVITDNHLGDWGLQAGILIAAVKLFAKKSASKLSIHEILELYVKFNAVMKEHNELEAKAKLETKELQEGRTETLRLWKILQRKSIEEFQKSYRVLGVKFDYFLGESAYRKLMPAVVQELLRRKVAKRSEGALIIPLEETRLPPVIIQKQDGGYLYHTFDLVTIYWRNTHLEPRRVLYVVSNEQAFHFEQLLLAAKKLGWDKQCELIHVKFGLVRGEDLKRLSTRRGKTILLDEVIEESVRRARRVVEKKNKELPKREKDAIARKVGIGALKYNDLSQNRNTDIIFDWERMLSLEGNSAPYLQYTYARLKSIVRKAGRMATRESAKYLVEEDEISLAKHLLRFPEAVEDAAKDNLPNIIANYLWELGNAANSFYEKYPVLKAEPRVRGARLFLIRAVTAVLKQGLSLLGIEAPERI